MAQQPTIKDIHSACVIRSRLAPIAPNRRPKSTPRPKIVRAGRSVRESRPIKLLKRARLCHRDTSTILTQYGFSNMQHRFAQILVFQILLVAATQAMAQDSSTERV